MDCGNLSNHLDVLSLLHVGESFLGHVAQEGGEEETLEVARGGGREGGGESGREGRKDMS